MDNSELLALIDSPEQLRSKAREAMQMLAQR